MEEHTPINILKHKLNILTTKQKIYKDIIQILKQEHINNPLLTLAQYIETENDIVINELNGLLIELNIAIKSN